MHKGKKIQMETPQLKAIIRKRTPNSATGILLHRKYNFGLVKSRQTHLLTSTALLLTAGQAVELWPVPGADCQRQTQLLSAVPNTSPSKAIYAQAQEVLPTDFFKTGKREEKSYCV